MKQLEWNNKIGIVYVQNRRAGKIEDTAEGYVFAYDEEYVDDTEALPVSLTLPLRKEPFESTTLFPFFDGLIPEGWLLDVVVDNWKLNPKDRFSILLVACRDCIGDVCIRRVEE